MSAAYFHATPYDLGGQTHLLPPALTGREPHWEDMDANERQLVFLSRTLDDARGWGSEIAGVAGLPFFVYRVDPEGATVGTHVVAAPRARIVDCVFTYDPSRQEVSA